MWLRIRNRRFDFERVILMWRALVTHHAADKGSGSMRVEQGGLCLTPRANQPPDLLSVGCHGVNEQLGTELLDPRYAPATPVGRAMRQRG
jgi:hypothetical protein